ncbi:MAG: M23 family metallopeptidase [Acidobacteria bacterium]|nr:M23 family metallopeptidase [Acidobacteriota bacterium]
MYEVQFHPANIRKQVRYYFLSAKAARRIMALGVVLGVIMLVGVVLAPRGIEAFFLNSKLHVLEHQNQLARAVLKQRVASLNRLEAGLRVARIRERQMSLILGAPETQREEGLGGFPEPVRTAGLPPRAALAYRRAVDLDTRSKALLALADELARFAEKNSRLTQLVPSICPLPIGSFVLTSPFGERISPFTNRPDFHAGIDLAAREGTKVMAPGAGRVVFAGRFPLRRNVRWWRYGNVIVLANGDRYLTIFAHLKDILVRRGHRVARGEVIGTVGSTGWSTSPHLHYEVRVRLHASGEPVPVDPRIFILNYHWKGSEALLAARRYAPPPAFDPLPFRIGMR